MANYWKTLSLFFGIVWRETHTGERMPIFLAWEIAKAVHLKH